MAHTYWLMDFWELWNTPQDDQNEYNCCGGIGWSEGLERLASGAVGL